MKLILRDDSAQVAGKNGQPALAGAIGSAVKIANTFSLRARSIFNWWGGNSNTSETAAAPQVTTRYLSRSAGHPHVYAQPLIVPIPDAPAVPPATGLKANYSAPGQDTTSFHPLVRNTKENINEPPSTWYPDFCHIEPIYRILEKSYAPGVATALPLTIRAGGPTPDIFGPQLRSGMIIEGEMTGLPNPAIGKSVISVDGLTAGNDIIGSGGAGTIGTTGRDLAGIRDFINALAREKRITFGWCLAPGAGFLGASGIVITATTPRYILNTNVGPGGGAGVIAPTILGPGIPIPLRYTGHGRHTTVRIYVSVLARMTGGGTGTLSYYNRDASTTGVGGLVGPTALVNGPTISGTTLQWYPSGTSWVADTWPYLLGNAIPERETDRIILCGQSSGASGLEIVAFTMTVLDMG